MYVFKSIILEVKLRVFFSSIFCFFGDILFIFEGMLLVGGRRLGILEFVIYRLIFFIK